jgi:phospholipase D1/2
MDKYREDNRRSSGGGGIQELVAQSNVIGNVITAALSQKNSFEPLPFTDYSSFNETYTIDQLKINRNLYSGHKVVFHPKQSIQVSVSAERKHGSHIFHPYIYTLSFKHDKYSWEVIRSYKEVKETHKTLAKIVKEDLGRSCSDISKDDFKPDWPMFPTEHDHLITQNQIPDRCKHIAEYLERILTYPPFRDHPDVLHLLGVSPLSFIIGLSPSIIEGSIQKRTGDNVYYGHLSQLKICCDNVKIFHAKRWFILKDTFLVYLNQEVNFQVGFLMLLDRAFECKMKIRAGAYHAIVIKNLQRSFVLKCKSAQQQKEWYDRILGVIQGPIGRLFCNKEYLNYGSFAPIRPKQKCKWYINAQLYMEHVMLAINNAKEEIYITDWWLCPEIFLKRPTDDLQYRLDKILLKKSQEGVKIFILLFKEVSFALSLLSSRAKNILTNTGKNPNIKVLRHPEHTPSGVFLWSHHEKCVIVDQSIAFMGGIDLCFGRWDDDLHR